MSHYDELFPRISTKVAGLGKKFNLADPKERLEYFQQKVGEEIVRLKEFLKTNTFIGYWLGKKNSGKGTYTKLLMEIFGADKICHISAGDMVRDAHQALGSPEGQKEIKEYLEKNYRGPVSVKECIQSILNRSQEKITIPDELILALLKREIDKHAGKVLFLDGFPRTFDQVSYSLFFRDLINHRQDPDVFLLIEIPESVIDERMKYRVICPKCHTPRNTKLFVTREVDYDVETKKFHLICDNPACGHARMVGKEGDSAGIESIRERLKLDDQLMERVVSLHGVPKVLLRNSVPVVDAKNYVDDYEITPEYVYEWDAANQKVIVAEKPWTVKDDAGKEAYSLLAPPAVVALLKQLANVLTPKESD